MVASVDFAEFLREQLAPLGPVTVRRMFGKSGVFVDGVMLGMVTSNVLYLRVDDLNKAFFQEAAGAAPLNYEKGGQLIDLAFWRVPDRLLDEPAEFVAWAHEALAAAHRVARQRYSSARAASPPAARRPRDA
jgi:DNA transformation protein and related proteins